MNTRLMATAILINNDKILMLHRAANRKLAPGLWTGVGGHLEPEEINDPERACIREIAEETGIEYHEIADLTFKYLLIRSKETEIREQFVYFGKTTKNDLTQTVEGKLHWVHRDHLLNLEMPWIIKAMLEHYDEKGKFTSVPYVGVMSLGHEGISEMHWSELTDPEIL